MLPDHIHKCFSENAASAFNVSALALETETHLAVLAGIGSNKSSSRIGSVFLFGTYKKE